jgi:hypothetical protein
MTNPRGAAQSLLIYGLVLPLALLVGYLLATPGDLSSAGTIGLFLLVLCAPLFLKWHHPLLVLSWNMGTSLFFLPGSPALWMIMAFVSLMICVAQRALDKEMRFISAPSLAWPIVCLGIVVLVTAEVTGGFGMRVFGGSMFGGRRYVLMLAAMAGYFAMTGVRIPVPKANLFVAMFFLGSLTNAVASLIPYGPKEFYFLALIFPVNITDAAVAIESFNSPVGAPTITRFFGLTLAASGAFGFLLARYGIRNLLEGRQAWRAVLLLFIGGIGAMGGFRGFIITSTLTFLLVFAFEGLLRTKYALILVLSSIALFVLMVPFARYLPLSIQRSLSTLPLNIDPIARYDAEASSQWRIDMWTLVLPEVPTYFWMGKGCGIDSREIELASGLSRHSLMSSQEATIRAGEYHSGPLTALIPFGIWGFTAWVWLLIAGLRALYLNFKYGAPELKTVNTFLFAYFLARTIVFFLVFGNLYSDVADFLGLLGMSISLNHGIRKSYPQRELAEENVVEESVPIPALSRA